MTSSDLCYLGAVEAIAAFKARKLSPVELMDAHLKQIEKYNPQVNAFIRILAEQAIVSAKAAEKHLTTCGPVLPPLHGIPVSIKDSFNIAGLPTTCGSRFYADSRAAHDATANERLAAKATDKR